MATTLDQLLTATTATDLKARLLALLQAKGYPTTDWTSGSIDRSLVELFADALADQTSLTPQITSGGFNELASGLWLDLLSEQLYNQLRNAASHTEGIMRLSCAATAGPYTITVGQLRAVFAATGNVYFNVGGGSLPSGGTLDLTWKSESPNQSDAGLNYIDGNNAAVSLQTSLAGVTIATVVPDFSPVTLAGNGTGTATPSRINPLVTPTPTSLLLRIDSSGDVGVATFSYNKNGTGYVSGGFVTATYDLVAENIRITFANGAGTPNSFLKNDVYSLVTPGSWVTVQGTDAELDPALQTRNRGRWPLLSLTPTEDAYATMARNASSSVTDVRVSPSITVPGGVDIVIAGQAGALAPSVVTTVQTYIDQRTSVADRPLVQSASPIAVTLSGTVTVKLANLAQAQSEAQTNVGVSVRAAGIGGTYYLAQATEDLMATTGVVNVQLLKINGVAADLVFGTVQIGSFTQSLATALSWVTV